MAKRKYERDTERYTPLGKVLNFIGDNFVYFVGGACLIGLAVSQCDFTGEAEGRDKRPRQAVHGRHALAGSQKALPEPARKPQRAMTEDRMIEYHCRMRGVDPDIVRAIRRAENGVPGREFGIIPTDRYREDEGFTDSDGRFIRYRSEVEKQCRWCVRTVEANMGRWKKLSKEKRKGYTDFIDFMGDRYCPVGAENDPNGLNANWERNVRFFYNRSRDAG